MKTTNLEFDDHNNRIHWIDERNIEWKSVYDYSGKSVDVCIYWAKFTAGLLSTMPEGGVREWQPGWLASQPDMLSEDWGIVE